MRKILLLFSISFLILTSCEKDEKDNFENLQILEKLNSLKGVTAIEIDNQVGYGTSFQIDIIQPVDHNNPSGASFSQRIYLTHTDEDMPMVFAPSGYAARPTSGQEIARQLQTNCLNVTHRYFVDATPSGSDWSFLTMEQAANDHHRIVEIFKKIYTGVWISSGVSKGGSTCTYHKYYFPEDVNATIAYVAPYKFGIDDQRFEKYLENIGPTGCYEKLKDFQKIVFENRAEMLEILAEYMNNSNYTWSLEPNLVLELVTMDYPFIFWQYDNVGCSEILTEENTLQEIFNHLISVVPVESFSDYYISYYAAYYYQAITETGAPGYDPEFYNGLLTSINLVPGTNPNFFAVAPVGGAVVYDETNLTEIYNWLQTDGDEIIYIYGENDPWTAGAIELSSNVDALKIVQVGENHGVKIVDLDNPDIVYDKLEEWTGVDFKEITYGGNLTFARYKEENFIK